MTNLAYGPLRCPCPQLVRLIKNTTTPISFHLDLTKKNFPKSPNAVRKITDALRQSLRRKTKKESVPQSPATEDGDGRIVRKDSTEKRSTGW